jgi:hypothetical protein
MGHSVRADVYQRGNQIAEPCIDWRAQACARCPPELSRNPEVGACSAAGSAGDSGFRPPARLTEDYTLGARGIAPSMTAIRLGAHGKGKRGGSRDLLPEHPSQTRGTDARLSKTQGIRPDNEVTHSRREPCGLWFEDPAARQRQIQFRIAHAGALQKSTPDRAGCCTRGS